MCTIEIMAAVEPLTKDELLMHTENADDCASVYVGTYHKYNCGSLKGAWVNLESFDDEDELMELSYSHDDMKIVKKMKEIVPEYKSKVSKYEILDK